MSGYIISILGIVVAGVLMDIIIPTGIISKYIKSIYSIFVVAVLFMPIINFISSGKGFSLTYNKVELQEKFLTYIFDKQVLELETEIEKYLSTEGLEQIDIDINFSINNNEIVYDSCLVNLEKLVITSDNQHINKYEFIKDIYDKVRFLIIIR